MLKATLLIILLMFGSVAEASSTRTLYADSLQSPDLTKTWVLLQNTAQLGVANGGTGLSTITSGGVVIGAGASAPTAVTCSSATYVLTWSGSSWSCSAPVSGTARQEVPSGTVNGSNVTFTLANTPSASANVVLHIDGLVLIQTVDYTISSSTITMTTAPANGQKLLATYWQ